MYLPTCTCEYCLTESCWRAARGISLYLVAPGRLLHLRAESKLTKVLPSGGDAGERREDHHG